MESKAASKAKSNTGDKMPIWLKALLIFNVILVFIAIFCFAYKNKITDAQKVAVLKPYGHDANTAVAEYDKLKSTIARESYQAYWKGYNSGSLISSIVRKGAGNTAKENYFKNLDGAKKAVHLSNKSLRPYLTWGHVVVGVMSTETVLGLLVAFGGASARH
jgi:hypothetical protein